MHYVILDIETTGFSPASHEITQIAAVRMRGGVIRHDETFCTFVKTEKAIPAHITGMTGITNANVRNAPPPAQALRDFSRYAADAILIAHNASFDTSFIEASIRRHGLPVRPARCIDSVHLARRLWPRQANKLDDILNRLQIPIPADRHNALADARLLAAVLGHILPKLHSVPLPGFDTLLPMQSAA